MDLSLIPREKGVYILVMRIDFTITIALSIGLVVLEPGLYAYIGSARSFGGLRSRIKHHLTKNKKKLWWHIDYITSKNEVKFICIIYALTELDLEENLAEELSKNSCWNPAVRGFGSTDRKSFTHLFKCVCNSNMCINRAKETVEKLVKGFGAGIIWIDQ
jgi:Uri superfamily endonuclease